MRALRWALPTAILGLLVSAAPGWGAPGDLFSRSCVSDGGVAGCTNLGSADALDATGGIDVSPDGRDVYIGADFGITHLRRAADGSLNFASRVTSSNFNSNGITVTVAPSGKFVYAISLLDSLVWFARNETTGALTQLGCVDDEVDADCGNGSTFPTNFPTGSVDFAQQIAITPNGETLYIADQSGSLLRAQVNTTTGAPTPASCHHAGPLTGCLEFTASANPTSVAVSPDGLSVYLNSISPGALFHFTRSPVGGTTALTNCVDGSPGAAPCTLSGPAASVASPGRISVAPNGTIYVQTTPHPTQATISRFTAGAAGSPTFANCASTLSSAPAPCGILPVGTLGPAGSLPISPDSQSIFTSIGNGAPRAITRLRADLSFASCISDGTVAGCNNVPAPRTLIGGKALAINPDGRDLYAVGNTGDAAGGPGLVNTFAIEGSAGVEASAGGGSGVAGDTTKPVISKLKAVKKKGKLKSFTFTSTEAGTATLKFTRKRGKKYKSAGSLTKSVKAGRNSIKPKKLKKGKYKLALTVADAAGNVSAIKRLSFKVK